MKLKTYVITLSKTFPQGLPRAGQPTNFRESLEIGTKIHTIRCNYDLWAKRLDEVIAGRAVLSIRQWSGKPYGSKQEVLKILTKEDGVGYQLLNTDILDKKYRDYVSIGKKAELSSHDGLTIDDFYSWFGDVNEKEAYIIIHFTPFRY
jgi:hypothetical protein